MSNSLLDWMEEALCAERQVVELTLKTRHESLVKVLAQELSGVQWKNISPSIEKLEPFACTQRLNVDKHKVTNSRVSPRTEGGANSKESVDAHPSPRVDMVSTFDAVISQEGFDEKEKEEEDVGNRLGHGVSSTVLGGRKTALDVYIPDDLKDHHEYGTSAATCVKHAYFEQSIGAAILLNACVLLLQADTAVRYPGQQDPIFFDVMEVVFFTVFAMELALKLYVFRWGFFTQGAYQWNWFDAALVLTALFELLMEYIVKTQPVNSTMLRLLRIIKISRLIRIIRAVRIFRELRIMVLSIVSTMRTLLWSIVCVLMIMACIGAYFAWVIADHLASNSEVDDEVVAHFGSVPQIMVTLFSAITGGADWRDFSDLLCEISPIACCVFFAYITMMVFAIMNILTGICVNNATQAADDDMDLCTEDLLKHDPYLLKLRQILTNGRKSPERTSSMSAMSSMNSLDRPIEDMLTWAQVKRHLGDPKVRAYFRKINLEPWQLRSFFQLLKVGNDEPQVCIDQFIRGCMRLSCTVKNIDLMAALHESKQYETRRYAELKCSIAEVGELVSEMQRRVELQKVGQLVPDMQHKVKL